MSVAKSQAEISGVPAGVSPDQRQRQRMLVALALLLIALIVVIAKDRQFWFPSNPVTDTDAGESITPTTTSNSQHKPKVVPHVAPERPAPKITAKSSVAVPAPPAQIARTPLPPLEVEVVSGNERRTIPTRNPSIKVELQTPGNAADAASVTSPASQRVSMSPSTLQVVSRPVQPNYPLLAKQMKVQGSVVLEALIGRDGLIQDLKVLSGPSILSDAARQAVMQWRFKPYLQSGQPIETEAKITVNFTISTD